MIVVYYGGAEPGDDNYADVVAVDSEIIRVLAMRSKKDERLCRTLTAAERAEVEKQLRDRGLLRAATEAELKEMRKQKAHAAARRP